MRAVLIDVSGKFEAVLFHLDVKDEELDACAGTLDEAEQARAARFRHHRDRARFIARRAAARRHLAAKLETIPTVLRIAADELGKPYLPDAPALHFNLSHANGLALLVTAREPVGCDLAWRNPALACGRVAARLFAAEEVAALDALPPARWVEGFYHCWTRKEAYVKALGVGLSLPLDTFAVSVAPDQPAELLRGEAGWALASFEPALGFQAAVVTAS